MSSLAQMEIGRHPWTSVTCGCGRPSDHILNLLKEGIEGNGVALRALDGHVFIESNLQPPAPAVCAVAMAALVDTQSPDQIKQLLWLILSLAAGEEDGDSAESSVYWKCRETIRDGLWLIYHEAVNSNVRAIEQYALDIAEIAEWDVDRLNSYQQKVRGFKA
ncbi:hypothetical protein [Streptomyces sp. NPDC051662]|uniref:hypothetical protein n=1 Tax=Streptomyces sp. NPDC051662 TaxID=3154750 RepID=UPI00343B77ED